MLRTGSTNPRMMKLVKELKDLSLKEGVNIWKRIAVDLEKPSRQRRIVNLSSLNLNTKENDNVIVPGKVLGDGVLDHKVTVAAFGFSGQAKTKMSNVKAELLSIEELMQKNPKGKNLRIIG